MSFRFGCCLGGFWCVLLLCFWVGVGVLDGLCCSFE